METILASSSVSPQPSTPVSTPTIPDTCVPQLVDLVHVRVNEGINGNRILCC